jgi:HlyD family secretion protein
MSGTRVFFGIVALAGLAGGGVLAWKRAGGEADAARYRTAAVERGEVVEGIQASGAVQPVVLVQVGTQVSGVIEKILVDFNSEVKANQPVAVLDSRRLQMQVVQDKAAVARAKADVERVKAQLAQAEKDLVRQRTLFAKQLVGQADLDAAVAAADALRAQVAVAEASVTQAEAQLEGSEVNLGYATIVSPVDGVVVSRNVDVGQTVAASLQAPTLFTIANDLTKIQVQASVPEADIGRIHKGQEASFTVDAYPEVTFPGTVSEVRLAPTNVQNVVTYTVLIDAANPKKLLLPGMTANVTFEVARSAPDALKVPTSALRLKPPPELVEKPAGLPSADAQGVPEAERARPESEAAASPSGADAAGRRGAGGAAGGQKRRGRHGPPGVVYVKTEAGLLRPIPVRPGVSDGTHTAVEPLRAGDLEEGMQVITAVLSGDEAAAGAPATNPFAPQRFRGGGRR